MGFSELCVCQVDRADAIRLVFFVARLHFCRVGEMVSGITGVKAIPHNLHFLSSNACLSVRQVKIDVWSCYSVGNTGAGSFQ